MGHAGAIISGGKGTAGDKIEAMRSAGITCRRLAGSLGQHDAEGDERLDLIGSLHAGDGMSAPAEQAAAAAGARR